MSSPTSAEITGRRRIIVADEDPKIVEFIITTLRQNGHAVFHAYDGLAATELVFAVGQVHLVITNTRVKTLPGVKLIGVIRDRFPKMLREPFSAEQLRAVVGALLSGKPQPTGLAAPLE